MNPTELLAVILRFALDSVLACLILDPKRDPKDLNAEREAAAAMLAALDPRDAVQAFFAARTVTAHHTSVECSRRAALPGMPDAMVARLIATGIRLSRQSVQMIEALEQCKGAAHSEAAADPHEAVLAASAPLQASRSEQQPGPQTSADSNDAQDPLSSEKSPAAPGITPPAPLYVSRQQRRHAERQAAKAARRLEMQRALQDRLGKRAA